MRFGWFVCATSCLYLLLFAISFSSYLVCMNRGEKMKKNTHFGICWMIFLYFLLNKYCDCSSFPLFCFNDQNDSHKFRFVNFRFHFYYYFVLILFGHIHKYVALKLLFIHRLFAFAFIFYSNTIVLMCDIHIENGTIAMSQVVDVFF